MNDYTYTITVDVETRGFWLGSNERGPMLLLMCRAGDVASVLAFGALGRYVTMPDPPRWLVRLLWAVLPTYRGAL